MLSATSSAWTRTDDNNDNLKANANMFSTEEEFEAEFNVNGFAKDDFAMGAHGGTLYFYKDIDIVNMKVSDGTIVDRLSVSKGNFNWSSTKDGVAVDIMTYYPGHYIKRWQDPEVTPNAKEYIQLSMFNFDGAMYVEPYYRGTFETVSVKCGNNETTLRSYAGGSVYTSQNIENFRNYAKSNANNKMSIGDWRDFDFLCLYLIKYANYNSQAKVGDGIVNLYGRQITGYSNLGTGIYAHDTLQGRDGYIGTNGQTSVWCLGLCNPWGNVWEFVDGITIIDQWAYVCTDPSNYDNGRTSSDYGYSKLSYQNWTASAGYPGKVGYDTTNSSNQLIGFPTATGGSAIAGISDYYWSASGVRLVLRGGLYNFTHANYAGAFYFPCNYLFTYSDVNCGCRLLKTA